MGKYFYKGLAHIGIMTDDPDKCAKFYIDNLGFRPYHEAALRDFKIVFVENNGMIIEFVGKGGVPHPGTVDHIAIEVQGIEALVEELRAKGIEFESDTINTMSIFPSGCKNIFFKGPAGERVEFFDFTK